MLFEDVVGEQPLLGGAGGDVVNDFGAIGSEAAVFEVVRDVEFGVEVGGGCESACGSGSNSDCDSG